MNYEFGCCENGKHLQKTMKITTAVAFLLSFGWVRLGADILHNNCYNCRWYCDGDGRHYNTYYVIIAWEWFLCVFSVCFLDWV
mgnify:CR=1 FL=1